MGENTEVLYPKTAAEIAQNTNRTSINRQRPQSMSPGGREQSDVTSRNDVLESSSKSRVRREVSNTHDAVVEALESSQAQEHEHEQGVLNVTSLSDLLSTTNSVSDISEESVTTENLDSSTEFVTTTLSELPIPIFDASHEPIPFKPPMRKVSFLIPPEEIFFKIPMSRVEKKTQKTVQPVQTRSNPFKPVQTVQPVPSQPIYNRFGAVEFFDDISLKEEVEKTSEIVKKKALEIPHRKIRHSHHLEEIADGVQHDYPVFSYGQDEYEIIKLQKEGKLKKPDQFDNEVKESPTDLGNNDTNLHDIELHGLKLTQTSGNKIKNDGKVSSEHLLMNETLQNRNQSETFPTELENPVETRNTTRHSKRVLVNVTIETEDDEKGLKPVYVVSLSVPTEESKSSPENLTNVVLGFDNNVNNAIAPPKKLPQTTPRYGYFYGGQCECSCPCLESDENEEISSTSMKYNEESTTVKNEKLVNEVDINTSTIPSTSSGSEDLTDTSLISSSTESNSVSSTENTDELKDSTSENLSISTDPETTTETETSTVSEFGSSTNSLSTTSEGCPIVTTPTPQPPMILILEGEDAVFCLIVKELSDFEEGKKINDF